MNLPKSMVVTHCPTCGSDGRSIPIHTTRTVLKEGLMRLTDWVQSGERIVRHWQWPVPHTDYILGDDWLKAEAARVIKTPGRRAAYVVNTKTGDRAIYVNRVAGNPGDDDEDED
jgi:hypothetical protein